MSTFDQIASHMEFLGYEVTPLESGGKRAKHPRFFNHVIQEFGGGFLFSALFRVNARGKRDRSGVMEGINEMNRDLAVCRCYIDKDFDFIIEAWYPNFYDRAAFGSFIDRVNNDIRRLGGQGVKLAEYLE